MADTFSARSVGDLFALSQLAWRISRAFAAKTTQPPREFSEVESEADDLSDSLRLFAEALHVDDRSLCGSINPAVQHGIEAIIQSTRTTLEDLDSLVDRYKVIKKTGTESGFVVEKNWSDMVLAYYKNMIWTTGKGDIVDLKSILEMHSHITSLTMQALHSKSADTLEATVVPLASKLGELHTSIDGSLSQKLDDIHSLVFKIANGTLPFRTVKSSNNHAQSRQPAWVFQCPPRNNTGVLGLPQSLPWQQNASSPRKPSSLAYAISSSSVQVGQSDQHEVNEIQRNQESYYLDVYLKEMSVSDRRSIGASGDSGIGSVNKSKNRRIPHARRDSDTVPSELTLPLDSGYPRPSFEMTESHSSYSSVADPLFQTRSTTASLYAMSDPGTSIAAQQQQRAIYLKELFLKELFRNSAKLFDEHAAMVEYTQDNPAETDLRYVTEMVPVATECRVVVIRKRENLPHGGHTYITSIWTLSDDISVRVQQRLPELSEQVPLQSFFTPEKISLSGNTRLQYYSVTWGEYPSSDTHTNWINYIFGNQRCAASFQSAVFGRNLLDTFKTEKTTVIHKGIRGAFTFEEQMCGIENLRLWEEDGVSLPGAAGGVFALIHLSPSFGEGWIRFWVNNSNHLIRVKNDSGRMVKVKDLNIITTKPGSAQKNPSGKIVAGIRIEFTSDEEKRRFLALVSRAQENLVALPNT